MNKTLNHLSSTIPQLCHHDDKFFKLLTAMALRPCLPCMSLSIPVACPVHVLGPHVSPQSLPREVPNAWGCPGAPIALVLAGVVGWALAARLCPDRAMVNPHGPDSAFLMSRA